MSLLTYRERVLMFFTLNPDEELTSRDAMVKFDMPTTHLAREVMRRMVALDLVAQRGEGNEAKVYSIGAALKREAGL